MKIKKSLIAIYDQLQVEFMDQYELVQNKREYEPENIRRMRSTIKKQKAFLDILSFLNPDFPRVVCNDYLDHLHKDMGRLRDVQITGNLLFKIERKLQINNSASNYFKKITCEEWDKFYEKSNTRSLLPFHMISQFVYKYLEEVASEILPTQFEEYLSHKWDRVTALLKRKKIPFHKLRKRLKELYSTLQIVNVFLGYRKVDQGTIKALKKIINLLGEHQNFKVVRTLSKSFICLNPKLVVQIKADQKENTLDVKECLNNFNKDILVTELNLMT